jgi:hypothetical protein
MPITIIGFRGANISLDNSFKMGKCKYLPKQGHYQTPTKSL